MSDSSTDSQVVDQEAILVRFVDPESKEPVTHFASIEAFETGTAPGVFTAIRNGLSKVDISLDDNAENCPTPKLVCVNVDGVAVNMGPITDVAKKLLDCVSHPVIVTHCVAHKLELGIVDAVKEVGYLKKFEDTLKRVCHFYAYSPKRKSELKTMSSILDEHLIMPVDIKAIRWVTSKERALKALMADLHIILLSTSNKADELGQARAIHNDLLSQLKFVKYDHLMMDILTAVSRSSRLFQTKDLLIFEVREEIDTLYSILHCMTESPGDYLASFYEKYDQTSRMFDNRFKINGQLLPFCDDNDVRSLLWKMGDYIDARFSVLNESSLSYFKVFDFRSWPQSLVTLSTYGNTEIKDLCNYYDGKGLLSQVELKAIRSQTHYTQTASKEICYCYTVTDGSFYSISSGYHCR